MSADRIGVLVVDDHPTFRSGLQAVLSADPGVQLLGEAENGETAVTAAAAVRPDVVLMDLAMPGMGGVEATRRITREVPSARVLVLTMSDADASLFAALRAGAHGYLLKDAGHEEILGAVRDVAAGRVVFGARIAGRVLAYFTSSAASVSRPYPELSERERDVLELLVSRAREALYK